MRIVGGKHRGRALAAPPGASVRPTSDRAREALFNILAHGRFETPFRGATVVDAFAGTGALGLEALSRGAAAAFFIESDRKALASLRANIRALGEDKSSTVLAADATHPPPARAAAAVAFLDPPYRSGLGIPALSAMSAAGWLAPGAIATLEIAAKEPFEPPEGFELLDDRRYGAARILILRRL